MKQFIDRQSLIPLLLLFLLCGGCERRPLEDEYVEMALIPIRIDWSESRIPQKSDGTYAIHRVTVLFYPQEGGIPLEYYLEEDITARDVEVPVGKYSILVLNETPDRDDWNNIYFTGMESYKTFAAHAKVENQKGFYTSATEKNLYMQPEPLAAWAMDSFEVTKEMVEKTRQNRAKNVLPHIEEPSTRALTGIKPLPRSLRVQIKARVMNLASAVQATGVVRGVVTGVMMASGECINEYASHAVLLGGRQMEENGKDGTIGVIMYIFGQKPDESYEFQTDFVLTDGTLYTPPIISDPDLFIPNEKKENADYIIDVGIGSSTLPTPDNPNPDPDIPPIKLPDTGASAEVEVSNWDEVIIPII